jgi:uncharacterized protein YndB with AHSA1/START domain
MAADLKTITITRIFDAPLELVWKAWTEPERLKEWWGPKDWSSPSWELDLRVGGKFLYCMRSPEGQDIWGTGIIKKIDPMMELSFTDSFADKEGNVVSGSQYIPGENFPLEMIVTVRFEDLNGKTKMTLTHEKMPVTQGDGATQGWSESFDKLAEILN